MSVYTISIPPIFFKNHQVLQGQTLHIPKGQCTVFIGPSGVGKSTLFQAILKATSHLHCVSMKQPDQLLPWSTALCNVVLGAKLRGEAPPLDKARYMLKQVGLRGFENHLPHELSSGMRKRVALARTFMEKADIILLDEPFETLDMDTRKNLYGLTHKLCAGKTLLLISHDLSDVAQFANQVYKLTGAPAVAEKQDVEKILFTNNSLKGKLLL